MKYYRLLLPFALIFLLVSCNKDKEGSLTLRFVAQNDGDPLHMFQTQNSINTYPLQFIHLSMMISDIELLSADGNEHLRDIELVDLSFDDLASATEGFTIRIDDIPAKTYDGIRFGIGVAPDQNAQTPSEFPSNNPLSRTNYYWEAWDSYIFMKIEGKIDTDFSGDFATNFAYHTGTNELYRVLESNNSLTVSDGQDTELGIAFNYAELLEGMDIAGHPQNHNPADTVQIRQIVNNLQNAVTLFQ